MKYQIQFYQENGVPIPKSFSLEKIVKKSLEEILGRNVDETFVTFELLSIKDIPQLKTQSNKFKNFGSHFGYIIITVKEQGKIIYKHAHSIEEILSKVLKEEENIVGFHLTQGGHMQMPVFQTKPEVVQKKETTRFRIRRLEEPPLPKTSFKNFSIIKLNKIKTSSFVKVMIHKSVYKELKQTREFSSQVEEGGFLVGNVYLDKDMENTYFLEITGALQATHTEASLVHLTYTGDSFTTVKCILREQRPNERLLGWYHTHLFPATDKMGLSSIDLNLHFTTFCQPWQIAGLVNLDNEQHRTLRFYVRQEKHMLQCPQWVVEGHNANLK